MFEFGAVQKLVNLIDHAKSFQIVQFFFFQSLSMSLFLNFFSNEIVIQMSIYYLLAKVGFDTAENGPLKVCQKLEKKLE